MIRSLPSWLIERANASRFMARLFPRLWWETVIEIHRRSVEESGVRVRGDR